jgi:uncharacterized protein YyaL (SSP411 family)
MALGVVVSLWLSASSAATAPTPTFSAAPGAPAYDGALTARLRAAWDARPQGYLPHTRHFESPGVPRYVNRLFLSSSPYLLQHAHNPVDWHPWGDEAFELARRLRRPVLLSVGYSTCHWCHVMEEESFEDLEIARTLNEGYVAIKVDREERPDVDSLYMTAVQALTGNGGWPMTVWLTPDRRPFFGGTYFPARDGERGIKVGFLTQLTRLRDAYAQSPERIAKLSTELTAAVQKELARTSASAASPEARVLDSAFEYYRGQFDSANGGLRGAPKFPADVPVRFLLRYERRRPGRKAQDMAALTLAKMVAGGVHDHVGGGFHRYATDELWRVPHFEKMLYDNARLETAYLEAYQATGRVDFADAARDILAYVMRDMTSPDGAFYSATDADSPDAAGKPEEGAFYTWTAREVDADLPPADARLVKAYYGVGAARDVSGRSVLRVEKDLAAVGREEHLTAEDAGRMLAEARTALRAARAKRPAPMRDEKILAGWNGLMISAYAQAALVLGERRQTPPAERAADFVLTRMQQEGRLARSFAGGPGRRAFLSDYAFMIAGLLDLYEATGSVRWLREAISLDGVLERFYEDAEGGGFFLSASDDEPLLAREKPATDGAEPSGNSVQALNLLRLYELTSDDRYRARAARTLRAFGARLAEHPEGLSEMLLALDFQQDRVKEIVIVAPHDREEAEPFLSALRNVYLPNRVLSAAVAGDDLVEQAKLVPNLSGKIARNGQVTAYVCERQICKLPTTDPEAFAQLLMKAEP